MERPVALSLALAVTSLAACSPPNPTPGAPDAPRTPSALIGAPAPELHAELVSGSGPTTLAAARGKVVVVDFWATYCSPCKKSFPRYEELVKGHANEVAVIAVSVDGADDASKESIAEFAKRAGATFAVVWDRDTKAANAYRPPKMPSSYIVDRQGVVRSLHAGYEDGEEARIAAEVEQLIAAK